ncbi:hypothetical protein [Brevibacillus sp. H7]|uniref:hypothetical protein n=1 Tax=Brevibacillus sp. H7 TaxID=3349138 RepID=UPI0037F2B3A5
MTIQDRWTENQGVRIHWLEANADFATSLVPLLHIPGAFATAEKFLPEMEALAPRRCVALSQTAKPMPKPSNNFWRKSTTHKLFSP